MSGGHRDDEFAPGFYTMSAMEADRAALAKDWRRALGDESPLELPDDLDGCFDDSDITLFDLVIPDMAWQIVWPWLATIGGVFIAAAAASGVFWWFCG